MVKVCATKKVNDEEGDEDQGANTFQASENVIYINGPICAETVAPVIGFITSANAANELADIILFIQSPGGSLSEAFALTSVMRASRIPITTVALGQCDSAALFIAMAGHTRLIEENCSLLSHQYSVGLPFTKHSEILARYKDFEFAAKRVMNHYQRFTGLSEKDIRKYLLKDNDVFLSSAEGIEYNLFDDYFTTFDQLLAPVEEQTQTLNEEVTA